MRIGLIIFWRVSHLLNFDPLLMGMDGAALVGKHILLCILYLITLGEIQIHVNG